MNRKTPKTNKTGFKGVSYDNGHKKFYARITVNKKNLNLGGFKSAEDAYKAYVEAAKMYYGEFARLE